MTPRDKWLLGVGAEKVNWKQNTNTKGAPDKMAVTFQKLK